MQGDIVSIVDKDAETVARYTYDAWGVPTVTYDNSACSIATVGVVLPSFIVILIVAAFIKNLLKYPPVKTFIASMRPALGGLILSVAVTMALTVFFGIDTVKNINFSFEPRTLVVLAVIIAVPLVWKHFKKKEFSSILLVAISGVLGMVLFGF